MISITDGSDESDTDNPEADNPVTVRGVGRGKKKDLWALQKDVNGEIILPDLDETITLQNKKQILRSFLTATYRMFSFSFSIFWSTCDVSLMDLGDFTNNRKAAVPWGELAATPGKWIKNWDDSMVLKEPTKMVSSAVDTVYHFLLDGQSRGEPLVWIQAADRDKRSASRGGEGKGKAREVKPKSDDDQSEEEVRHIEDDNMSLGSEKMDVEIGSSRKRAHAMSDAPPAKKQKKLVADTTKRNTRCVVLQIYPLHCSFISGMNKIHSQTRTNN